MDNSDLEKFIPKNQSGFIYQFSFTSENVYWVTTSLIVLFIANMTIGYFAIKWIAGRITKKNI